jgi:hypothetical protein
VQREEKSVSDADRRPGAEIRSLLLLSAVRYLGRIFIAEIDIYRTWYYIFSVRIYKTRPFSRSAKKVGLSDTALKAAVEEMRKGIIHVNLGGNVYKQRVAIEGQGKRGGSRVIIAADLRNRWIFVHCWSKHDKGNISRDEATAFKEFAHIYLNLNEEIIQTTVERGILEVLDDDETQK